MSPLSCHRASPNDGRGGFHMIPSSNCGYLGRIPSPQCGDLPTILGRLDLSYQTYKFWVCQRTLFAPPCPTPWWELGRGALSPFAPTWLCWPGRTTSAPPKPPVGVQQKLFRVLRPGADPHLPPPAGRERPQLPFHRKWRYLRCHLQRQAVFASDLSVLLTCERVRLPLNPCAPIPKSRTYYLREYFDSFLNCPKYSRCLLHIFCFL